MRYICEWQLMKQEKQKHLGKFRLGQSLYIMTPSLHAHTIYGRRHKMQLPMRNSLLFKMLAVKLAAGDLKILRCMSHLNRVRCVPEQYYNQGSHVSCMVLEMQKVGVSTHYIAC